MIYALVKYCMVMNSTMCQTMEITPIDHKMTSVMECAIGGMMGNGNEFMHNGIRWRIAGVYCREEPSAIQQWLKDQKK